MLKNISFQPSRIEKSTPTSIISASVLVYHMELDLYRPGYLVYTDRDALMTSDGTTTHLIAGSFSQNGYREGVGAEARFNTIIGFVQISEKLIIVADHWNRCLRLIDRTTNNTSEFSGQCGGSGYEDGRPGRFKLLESAVLDKRDKNQLLILDPNNLAVRTENVRSRVVDTFVESDSLQYIRRITQEEKSGDLYVTAKNSVYRIIYINRTVSLISGNDNGYYRDSTLLDSQFNSPNELIFIAFKTLLVAERNNNNLRLLDIYSDKVTTLNATNSLYNPTSLLLTNNSLYVGQRKKILQCMCDYYSIFLT